MIRADHHGVDFDDNGNQFDSENHPYERFYCSRHPGNKIQVLCTKENFRPSLMCVKCIIDPEVLRLVKSENMLPIHDVINRAVSDNPSDTQTQSVKETLEQKFSEFGSRDYAGVYDRHVEAQMKKLDKEIERVKESLDELRYQFQRIFEKQSSDLRSKEEDLRRRCKEYIEEQGHIETLRYATSTDIINAILHMNDVEEYERFIKALYHKSAQGMNDNLFIKEFFDTTNSFRDRVNAMRNCKIDTSLLEEIRNRIDSLEMLDQSLQAYPANLNPKLVQTLEKIRNAEKKKSPPVRGNERQEGGHSSADKRRAEFLRPMQERLANSERRDKYADMEVEPGDHFDAGEYDDHYYQRDYQKQRKYSPDDEYYHRRTNTGTQTKGQGYGPSTSQAERYSRRMDEEEEYYKKQNARPHISSKKGSKDRDQSYRMQEENYEEQYDLPHSADFPAEDEFTFNRTPNPQKAKIQKPASSSKPKKTEDKEPKKGTASVKKNEASDTKHKKSVGKESKDKDNRKSSSTVKNSKGTKDKSGSLDKWIKMEENEKHRSKEKEKNRDKGKSEKKKKSGPTVHDFGYHDSGDEGTTRRRDSSTSPTGKKSERGPQGLHDWINRRVTGYLIFHNTMHDGQLEKEKDSDHLNRLTGKKWHSLSKAEREEYMSFAMNTRVNLKKQFKDVDNDDPELKDLQEAVDQKIKKIKKD